MEFSIHNEYDSLQTLAVCWGRHIPDPKKYASKDPEFVKFHSLEKPWNQNLLLKQQDQFFSFIDSKDVALLEVNLKPECVWQMFVRDVGFVVHETLYYNQNRKFTERKGESSALLETMETYLPHGNVCEILNGNIEGGDVMPTPDFTFIGDSSRTNSEAIKEMESHLPVNPLQLGDKLMHLDTRFTLLSNKLALIDPMAFNKKDLAFIQSQFECIPVTEQESKRLATNVFLVDPETIVIEQQEERIAQQLKERKFDVKKIDYSEPIKLGGSFRCTTLPLKRQP